MNKNNKCFAKYQKHTTAMTMVEILVVMVVFALISAMGINALTEYRTGSEFRAAGLEFENTLDNVRNLARNNVVSRVGSQDPRSNIQRDFFDSQINGYFIYYTNSFIEVYSCKKLSDPTYEYSCTLEPNLFKKNSYDVNLQPTGCVGVFYKNLSGDLLVAQNFTSGQLDINTNPSAICNLNLTHKKNPAKRKLRYEFKQNENTYRRVVG